MWRRNSTTSKKSFINQKKKTSFQLFIIISTTMTLIMDQATPTTLTGGGKRSLDSVTSLAAIMASNDTLSSLSLQPQPSSTSLSTLSPLMKISHPILISSSSSSSSASAIPTMSGHQPSQSQLQLQQPHLLSSSPSSATICIHRLCVRRNGQPSSGVETCYNDKGDMVKHGEQYIPLGIDTCTQCTCMHGKAEMCISVLCSPPENCRKYHEVTNKCCEFLCLDGGSISSSSSSHSNYYQNHPYSHHQQQNQYNGHHNQQQLANIPNDAIRFFNTTTNGGGVGIGAGKNFPKNPDSVSKNFAHYHPSSPSLSSSNSILSTSNFGLRLITSVVTSFLILALLLFMIHRVRQRRLLMMIRRLHHHQNRANPHLGSSRHPHHTSLPPEFDPTGGFRGNNGAAPPPPPGHLINPYGFVVSGAMVNPFGELMMEPPPPYTFWKPPTTTMPNEQMGQSVLGTNTGHPQPTQPPTNQMISSSTSTSNIPQLPPEAPPSYEESVMNNNNNQRVIYYETSEIIGPTLAAMPPQSSQGPLQEIRMNYRPPQPSQEMVQVMQSVVRDQTFTKQFINNNNNNQISIAPTMLPHPQPQIENQQKPTDLSMFCHRQHQHQQHRFNNSRPNPMLMHQTLPQPPIHHEGNIIQDQRSNTNTMIRNTGGNNLYYPQRLISHLMNSAQQTQTQHLETNRSTFPDQHITVLHVDGATAMPTPANAAECSTIRTIQRPRNFLTCQRTKSITNQQTVIITNDHNNNTTDNLVNSGETRRISSNLMINSMNTQPKLETVPSNSSSSSSSKCTVIRPHQQSNMTLPPSCSTGKRKSKLKSYNTNSVRIQQQKNDRTSDANVNNTSSSGSSSPITISTSSSSSLPSSSSSISSSTTSPSSPFPVVTSSTNHRPVVVKVETISHL